MSCDVAMRLRKTYRNAAVNWGEASTLEEHAQHELDHDRALLEFVSHKHSCPACLSEEPPFRFDSFNASSIQ